MSELIVNTISGLSDLSVGNTTVNSTVNSTSFSIGNTSITGDTLSVGNSTVNSTSFSTGNTSITGDTLSVGNTTVNTAITSTSFSTGNTSITGDTLSVGNTTVNSTVNSTSFSIGVTNITGDTLSVGNTTVNSTVTTVNVVRANTFQDTAGGQEISLTFLSEGTSKGWVRFNHTGTLAINDSFNVSSVTDAGTGFATTTLASPLADSNWMTQTTGTGASTSSGYISLDSGSFGGSGTNPYRSTTNVNSRSTVGSGSYVDHADSNILVFGALP